MALTTISQGNFRGFPLILTGMPFASANGTTLDAAGEEAFLIGRIYHNGGPGTTKSISNAGAAIGFLSSVTTFSNSGSTYRIGIGDVNSADGLWDGTFDAYADMVGGTDSIGTAGYVKSISNGSKTVTWGDLVAIGIEVQSRAGSDSLAVNNVVRNNMQILYPYGITDTGSGRGKSSHPPNIHIKFDDGSYGWFEIGLEPVLGIRHMLTYSINTGSNPDEYGLKWKLPFKCRVLAIMLAGSAITSGDDFELPLYSDPTGSPSLIEAVTFDPNIVQGTGSHLIWGTLSSARTLEADTFYGITLRPTTTNSISVLYSSLYGGANSRALFPVGTNGSLIYRDGNTGAFTEVTDQLPYAALWVDQIDFGSGSAGGPLVEMGRLARV